MSFTSLIRKSGQTATITRRSPTGTRDGYGRDEDVRTTIYTGPCYAELLTGEEDRSGREVQWKRLNVFLLSDAQSVRDDDRITIAGEPGGTDLNIEQVRPYRNPRTGNVHHVELRTRDAV